MQPSTLTVHEIFEKERRYTVPLFQRAYVWTEEGEWEPLWNDIERQAKNSLLALSESRQSTTSHFLGAIVLNVAKVFGRGLARSEIIDGQQRLTTLQIFLAALRDFAHASEKDVAENARRLTFNPVSDPKSDERFKVWPTNADRSVFRDVLDAGSLEAVLGQFRKSATDQKSSMPRIVEAYRFFFNSIQQFVAEVDSTEGEETDGDGVTHSRQGDCLYAILHALKTSLQFVVIELEERDDPQVIFETLNARGQPLLPSDLIRNMVFLEASSKGIDIDSLYEEYWRPFDERRTPVPDERGENRYWHQFERQGRLFRPRIDLFMFHDLTIRTERDLNIGRLFREFRDWYDQSTLSTQEYLASLKLMSEYFSQLLTPSGNDRLVVVAQRLRSLDTSTVYPILLLLMSAPLTKLSENDRDQVIEDLESFLVRRFVCQLTPKNYNRFFLSLLKRIKKSFQENENIVEVVRGELLRSSEPTSKWPTDDEFRHGWMQNPLYVKSRVDRVAMILRAVNEGLHTTKTEAFSTPHGLTVEHLLPQSAISGDNPSYPLPTQVEPGIDLAEIKSRRQQLAHTVGNLTLLTGPLNSSIGDGPFPEKAHEIAILSDLRLNAQFRDGRFTGWSETDITNRGEKLFSYALEIWPRHSSSPVLTDSPSSTKSSDIREIRFPIEKSDTAIDRESVSAVNDIVWSGEMNQRPDYFQGIILKSDLVILLVEPSIRPGARGQSLDRKAKAYVKDPLSVEKYLKRGLQRDDLAWDYQRNFISILNSGGDEIRNDPTRTSRATYLASSHVRD